MHASRICVLAVFVGSFLTAGVLQAADQRSRTDTESATSRSDLIVRVSGRSLGDGNLQIGLELGLMVTQAVRVYSEPSDTLLVAMVEHHFAESAEGQNWLASFAIETEARSFMKTSLPHASPLVTIPDPPESDDEIAVIVRGMTRAGENIDVLVSEVRVDARDFGFSTHSREGAFLPLAKGGFVHCCQSQICGQMCIGCSTPKFSCCLTEECCDIQCFWVPCCE